MAPGAQFPHSQHIHPGSGLERTNIWSQPDVPQDDAGAESGAAELAASIWQEQRENSTAQTTRFKDSGPPVAKPFTPNDFRLRPKMHVVKRDERLADIARMHLGAGASDKAVSDHVDAIAKLNVLQSKDLIITGQKLSLPGVTHDGGVAVIDEEGNIRVTWKDGSIRENKIDGSGIYRKPEQGGGYFEFAWGPRDGDAYRVQRPKSGEALIHSSDDNQTLEYLNSKEVEPWRKSLFKVAQEKIKNVHELSNFEVDMARFEQRARREYLPESEVAKTYQQVHRLLSNSGDQLTSTQRIRVAEQVMAQAARPTIIDQGDYNSCGISTIQVRTYFLYPSEAARLVTDVALTGKYTDKDGTTVAISTAPIGEAQQHPTSDGARSHASQLFQVAAVNLFYESENKKSNPPTHLRYEQHKPNTLGSESGEGVFDYADVVAGKSKTPRLVIAQPDLWDYALAKISNAITGRDERGFVLKHEGTGQDRDGLVASFNSNDDLRKKVAELSFANKLPASLRVHAENDPFYTDSSFGRAGGSGGWHQVTILRYLPETEEVYVEVDNTWGSKSDHARFKRMTVDELYAATRSAGSGETVKALEDLAQKRKERGQFDIVLEMDLSRQKRIANQLSNIDYVKQLDAAVNEWSNRQNNLSDFKKPESELTESQLALKIKVKQLTLPRFVGSQTGEPKLIAHRLRYQFGIDSNEAFEAIVGEVATEIGKHDRSKLGATEQQIWDSASAELQKALLLLPADRRGKLEEKIQGR